MAKRPSYAGQAAWNAALKAFVEARAIEYLGYTASAHEFICDFAANEGGSVDDAVFELVHDLAAELRDVARYEGIRLDG